MRSFSALLAWIGSRQPWVLVTRQAGEFLNPSTFDFQVLSQSSGTKCEDHSTPNSFRPTDQCFFLRHFGPFYLGLRFLKQLGRIHPIPSPRKHVPCSFLMARPLFAAPALAKAAAQWRNRRATVAVDFGVSFGVSFGMGRNKKHIFES